jgi:anti-anti-sigma factor
VILAYLEAIMISPREPLAIRSERTGALHRITPVGELDLATVSALEQAFETSSSDIDAEVIVVDLAELSSMDSTGINLLLLSRCGCRAALVCRSRQAAL